MNTLNNFLNNCFFLLVVTIQKKVPFQSNNEETFRMSLSDAKSSALNVVEEMYVEVFREIFPDVWKNIRLFQSFTRIPGSKDMAFSAIEFAIKKEKISKNMMNRIVYVLEKYSNLVYRIEQTDWINKQSIKITDKPDIESEQLEELAEQRLRKIGSSSTRYPHQIQIMQYSAVVQYFKDKPMHTTGQEDRRIYGEIVGFFSYLEKCYVDICDEQGTLHKVEYLCADYDESIRHAIDNKSDIEVLAREKIDAKGRLYWGIVDLFIS